MKFIIVNISILLLSMSALAQDPVSNDTIICIIDTTNVFTQFNKHQESLWQVNIKGSYYAKTDDEDLASIVFYNDFQNIEAVSGNMIIFIPVNSMIEKYTVVTDVWLNQQTDLYIMRDKVGFAAWDKYNFLIFKQDLDKSKKDKVKAYRVAVGYSEVQY